MMRLDELKVCPSLHGIKLDEWTTLKTNNPLISTLMNVNLNDVIDNDSESEEEDEASFADEDPLFAIPIDEEGGFEIDDDATTEDDFDGKTTNSSHNGEPDMARVSSSFSSGNRRATHSFVLSTNLQQQDISYFDKALRAHWAGAEHWKLSNTRLHYSKCC
jgi:hypothetical protein